MLKKIRKQIQEIDEAIIELLHEYPNIIQITDIYNFVNNFTIIENKFTNKRIKKELIRLLRKRFAFVIVVGQIKKENNIEIFQKKIWDNKIHVLKTISKKRDIPLIKMIYLFGCIHKKSLALQK